MTFTAIVVISALVIGLGPRRAPDIGGRAGLVIATVIAVAMLMAWANS